MYATFRTDNRTDFHRLLFPSLPYFTDFVRSHTTHCSHSLPFVFSIWNQYPYAVDYVIAQITCDSIRTCLPPCKGYAKGNLLWQNTFCQKIMTIAISIYREFLPGCTEENSNSALRIPRLPGHKYPTIIKHRYFRPFLSLRLFMEHP